jgi:hypothetical protein
MNELRRSSQAQTKVQACVKYLLSFILSRYTYRCVILYLPIKTRDSTYQKTNVYVKSVSFKRNGVGSVL